VWLDLNQRLPRSKRGCLTMLTYTPWDVVICIIFMKGMQWLMVRLSVEFHDPSAFFLMLVGWLATGFKMTTQC
jgi:hypothetical protein